MKHLRTTVVALGQSTVFCTATLFLLFTLSHGTRLVGQVYSNLGMIGLNKGYASNDARIFLWAQQNFEAIPTLSATERDRFWLGMAYKEFGNQSLADGVWRESQEIAITYFDTRGDTARSFGHFSDAKYFYELIHRIDPSDSTSDLKLGLLYVDMNQLDLGLAHLSRSLEIGSFRHPEDRAKAHYWAGNILVERKEWSSAIENLELATRLKPKYVDAHLLLADVYYHLGDFDNAYRVYSEVLGTEFELVSEQFQALFGMGKTCMKLGRFHEAILYLETAEDMYWADSSLYLALGDAHRTVGETEIAVDYYSRVIEISKNDRFIELARQHIRAIGAAELDR